MFWLIRDLLFCDMIELFCILPEFPNLNDLVRTLKEDDSPKLLKKNKTTLSKIVQTASLSHFNDIS